MNFDFKKIYDEYNVPCHLAWLLEKSGNMKLKEALILSIIFAKQVLPIFDKHKIGDTIPKKIVELAEQMLSFEITPESLKRNIFILNYIRTQYRIAARNLLRVPWHDTTTATDYATYTIIHTARAAEAYFLLKEEVCTICATGAILAASFAIVRHVTEDAHEEILINLSNKIRETIPNPFN